MFQNYRKTWYMGLWRYPEGTEETCKLRWTNSDFETANVFVWRGQHSFMSNMCYDPGCHHGMQPCWRWWLWLKFCTMQAATYAGFANKNTDWKTSKPKWKSLRLCKRLHHQLTCQGFRNTLVHNCTFPSYREDWKRLNMLSSSL
jgi:hypothetical protein